MTIVIFVVVSILSGFTQQMVTNRFAQSKNVAITLAESKIEDYLKFPAAQMPAGSVDYIVEKNKSLVFSTSDPDIDDQYRRTVTITPHPMFPGIIQISVIVEYGKSGTHYPFRVALSTSRGG